MLHTHLVIITLMSIIITTMPSTCAHIINDIVLNTTITIVITITIINKTCPRNLWSMMMSVVRYGVDDDVLGSQRPTVTPSTSHHYVLPVTTIIIIAIITMAHFAPHFLCTESVP